MMRTALQSGDQRTAWMGCTDGNVPAEGQTRNSRVQVGSSRTRAPRFEMAATRRRTRLARYISARAPRAPTLGAFPQRSSTMPFQNLAFDVHDRVATIRVNRPDKL